MALEALEPPLSQRRGGGGWGLQPPGWKVDTSSEGLGGGLNQAGSCMPEKQVLKFTNGF